MNRIRRIRAALAALAALAGTLLAAGRRIAGRSPRPLAAARRPRRPRPRGHGPDPHHRHRRHARLADRPDRGRRCPGHRPGGRARRPCLGGTQSAPHHRLTHAGEPRGR